MNHLISFSENDRTVKAYICLERPAKYKPQKKFTYHYYYKNKIHQNQGGYTGSLLHGRIEVSNAEKQLVEQGNFKYGLKHGRWVRWHENGKIAEINHWRKGYKHGVSTVYDQSGVLITKYKYVKGKERIKKEKLSREARQEKRQARKEKRKEKRKKKKEHKEKLEDTEGN